MLRGSFGLGGLRFFRLDCVSMAFDLLWRFDAKKKKHQKKQKTKNKQKQKKNKKKTKKNKKNKKK